MTMAEGLRWGDLPAPTVQCHAANLCVLPDGDLACVWFGGTQEGVADIAVWFSRRADDGAWSVPVRLSDDTTRSEQNPILFPAPDGRLWLIHTAQVSGHQNTAVVRRRVSDDGGTTWGPTAPLFDRDGVFVRQPVVVRPGGAWLVPVFHCPAAPGTRWSGDHDTSAVMVSTDQGRSWAEHAVPGSTGCVHMNLLPARDGRTLLAFFRSRWADHVYRSVSHDDGRTWSAPEPTALPNNNSSIQVTRLSSGRLAIAFNASSAANATERRTSLYDEIDDENDDGGTYADTPTGGRKAFWGAPRAPMTVALSDDEGLTWPMQRDVETGDGYCMTNNSADRRNRELSYPSIVQAPSGTLHLAYTHHRQAIRHVELTEDWIAR